MDKKETFLDRQFTAFVNLVQSATKNGTTAEVTFEGVKRKVTPIQALNGLDMDKDGNVVTAVDIDGTIYSLSGKLISKGALAAAGILGNKLTDRGQRIYADQLVFQKKAEAKKLQNQKKKEHKEQLHRQMIEFWGKDLGEKVWAMKTNLAKRPIVAKAAKSLIQGGVKLDSIPGSPDAARQAGFRVSLMSDLAWKDVVDLVTALTR